MLQESQLLLLVWVTLYDDDKWDKQQNRYLLENPEVTPPDIAGRKHGDKVRS